MPALSATIDLIDELMYRSWARRNFLPLERRDRDWHPIILEEMASRDRELAEQSKWEEVLSTTMNWGFVPLVPTVTHYVHPAHADIREPHFLSGGTSTVNPFQDSIYASGLYDFSY